VQPDGRVYRREIVEHVPGAAVVAIQTIDGEDHVLLVRQFRPAVNAQILELPAGMVDPGEEPIDCARRELEEETGYAAERVEPLISFYTSPGYCTELIHIFVATGLRESSDHHRDEEEDLELVRIPLRQAIDVVLHGELSDAKTIAGLLAHSRAPRSS
jgi:ADP-ribose pyrophosphatase